MKNILIIGGSYFAGRIFVEELLKIKEYNIYVFNRGNAPLQQKLVELRGDRENKDDIKNKIPDLNWDVLVDFCAYNPEHISKMLTGLKGSLKHYILISTTSIYENGLNLPLSEKSPKLLAPQPELGEYADYGYNKWLAECRLKEECALKRIKFTCLRPAIIYGEYNYAPRESWFFDRIRDEKPLIIPEPGLALFSFVYVVDFAHILIKSILNEKMFDQDFNVASGELVSYAMIYDVLKKITEKEFTTTVMDFEKIINKRIALPFPYDIHLLYSGKKLQETLDFKFTQFIDGMKTTYAYYLMVQRVKNKNHNI